MAFQPPAPIFRDIAQLAIWVTGRGSVVGIEGFCGSGKTRLAAQLAETCGGIKLETDMFVRIKGGPHHYPDRLDLEVLKIKLDDQLRTGATPVFLDGICLREIVKRIAVKPNLFIYVKHLSKPTIDNTVWHDGINLEMICEGESSLDEWQQPDRSAYEYHLDWKPHQLADAIYERLEAI